MQRLRCPEGALPNNTPLIPRSFVLCHLRWDEAAPWYDRRETWRIFGISAARVSYLVRMLVFCFVLFCFAFVLVC
jgi:hypothetical protein